MEIDSCKCVIRMVLGEVRKCLRGVTEDDGVGFSRIDGYFLKLGIFDKFRYCCRKKNIGTRSQSPTKIEGTT